ncbi:MAG TPA: glycosyltransferase family A protein [Caulobacteraceae bacterium]|jgi:hypothetical protein|nr:glycosyltransferase family A protein [Caulobacteraceae bacterium]
MQTVIRPVIVDALESIYSQDHAGPIQIVIGVDVTRGSHDILRAAVERRPDNVSVTCLTLPYSTSVRHGGVHTSTCGGALMAILTLMANSRFVAYLDDDNTWRPNHLSVLRAAVEGKHWAHSKRMLISEETGEEIAVDEWDSVGFGRGRWASLGGFVDPNCLMIDKIALNRAVGFWSESLSGQPGLGADKNFFRAIGKMPHTSSPEITVDYRVRRSNILLRLHQEGASFS